ncbi:MAG: exosome complex RNA-binding protein Rrp4 [Halobacteria archaeon]
MEMDAVSPGKQVVLPGDLVAEDPTLAGEGTYVEGNRVFSLHHGIVESKDGVRVIPLNGRYLPMPGDTVIGLVTDMQFSGWRVDIGGPVQAFLKLEDHFARVERGELDKHLRPGDLILARVARVGPEMKIDLILNEPDLTVLREGRVMDVDPTRVRRIIGRGGSMIRLLKRKYRCDIVVATNGRAWVRGPDSEVEEALRTLKLIEAEAHTSGLTNRIATLLGVSTEGLTDPPGEGRRRDRPPREDRRGTRRDDGPRGEGRRGPRRGDRRPPRDDFEIPSEITQRPARRMGGRGGGRRRE